MKRIAIIFPGIGYTTDKPLLYYGLDIACECGYEEYRKLSFKSSNKNAIRGNEEAMKEAFAELYSMAEEQLADINWDQYDDILFISKSIGTIIAGAYAAKHGLRNVKHVLYTPLKYTYQYNFSKAIAFIGTHDAWGDYQEVVSLSEKAGVPIKVYPYCNHSLEVPDDVRGNLNRIIDIMEATTNFLRQRLPIAPGTNGYASIHHCLHCGKRVVKTQTRCPFCGEKIWDESDFQIQNNKGMEEKK